MKRSKPSLVPGKELPRELPGPDWTTTPEEGRALIKAFLRVHDPKVRAEIIAHVERIAAAGARRK